MAHSNPRMLIVAADPTLRFTLEELLSYYGYTVTTATDAAAAEALINERSFDVLLQIHSLAKPAELHQRQAGESEPGADDLDWIPI